MTHRQWLRGLLAGSVVVLLGIVDGVTVDQPFGTGLGG